jgi:hypothetical protein
MQQFETVKLFATDDYVYYVNNNWIYSNDPNYDYGLFLKSNYINNYDPTV